MEGTENWVGEVWEGEGEVEAGQCLWDFVEEVGGHQEVEAVLHIGNQKSDPSVQPCQCADKKTGRNGTNCYTVLQYMVQSND